ncbi:hypothetical protein GCM10022376_06750 [Yimella lutea]
MVCPRNSTVAAHRTATHQCARDAAQAVLRVTTRRKVVENDNVIGEVDESGDDTYGLTLTLV